MGLLASFRRGWFFAFVAILWFAILGQVFLPAEAISQSEARNLTQRPDLPKTLRAWGAFPAAMDKYLADHFGFRKHLVLANAVLRYVLKSPTSPEVLYGRNGHLFYLGEDAAQQSAGYILRTPQVKEFSDIVADLHHRLAMRNIPLLVAMPPNNSTANQAYLPGWMRGNRAFTEYDLALRFLAERGVPAIDLRPELQSQDTRPTYLFTDTHWNLLGAAIARNAIVRGLGHPEWQIDIDRAFKGYFDTSGGDLARFLGVASLVHDRGAKMDVSSYPPSTGPKVLVIGDSFAASFFPLIWANAGQLEVLETFPCQMQVDAVMVRVMARNPAYVVFATTERRLDCLK